MVWYHPYPHIPNIGLHPATHLHSGDPHLSHNHNPSDPHPYLLSPRIGQATIPYCLLFRPRRRRTTDELVASGAVSHQNTLPCWLCCLFSPDGCHPITLVSHHPLTHPLSIPPSSFSHVPFSHAQSIRILRPSVERRHGGCLFCFSLGYWYCGAKKQYTSSVTRRVLVHSRSAVLWPSPSSISPNPLHLESTHSPSFIYRSIFDCLFSLFLIRLVIVRIRPVQSEEQPTTSFHLGDCQG